MAEPLLTSLVAHRCGAGEAPENTLQSRFTLWVAECIAPSERSKSPLDFRYQRFVGQLSSYKSVDVRHQVLFGLERPDDTVGRDADQRWQGGRVALLALGQRP